MMLDTLKMLRDAALDLLFPPRCEICHTLQESVICADCRQQFEAITEPVCRECGLPLDPLAKTEGQCAECFNAPPPFDAARSAGIYQTVLRHAIHTFKYEMVRSMASPLGDFLADNVEIPFPLGCLCPVPLHPARERIRGFNQSLLLAKKVGERWSLPVEPDLLKRTQNTAPQMKLPHDERLRNIKGAFSAQGSLEGRSIGLVDDVYTTGSTLRECTKVLKRAGAERVLVIALARTVMR